MLLVDLVHPEGWLGFVWVGTNFDKEERYVKFSSFGMTSLKRSSVIVFEKLLYSSNLSLSTFVPSLYFCFKKKPFYHDSFALKVVCGGSVILKVGLNRQPCKFDPFANLCKSISLARCECWVSLLTMKIW